MNASGTANSFKLPIPDFYTKLTSYQPLGASNLKEFSDITNDINP